MQDLPRIFNEKGAFIEPDNTGLDAPTLERLDAVRSAYQTYRAAEAHEKATFDEVNDAANYLSDLETYSRKLYPPQTQHDLWLENFGSPEARARAAQRRATQR